MRLTEDDESNSDFIKKYKDGYIERSATLFGEKLFSIAEQLFDEFLSQEVQSNMIKDKTGNSLSNFYKKMFDSAMNNFYEKWGDSFNQNAGSAPDEDS